MSEIYSGYTGLFRAPFNSSNAYSSTIYCMADAHKTTLIMIPLTPAFFSDAYQVAAHPQYQTIYIIPPALDTLYISDVYNLYRELSLLGNKNVQVVALGAPEIITADDFLDHIIDVSATHHFQITSYRNGVSADEISVNLYDDKNPLYRPCTDVEISDGSTTLYFSQYMSNYKLDWLDSFGPETLSEVHMSFAYNTYGGLTYLQCIDYKKELADRLVVNSFTNVDEFNYCAKNGIPTGKVRSNDFTHNS